MKITAEEIIKKLDLKPLEPEGGYFKRTWFTNHGNAIYYLMTKDSFSSFHRLSFDELWHFYAGDPVRQLQLFPDGRSEVYRIGSILEEGFVPQLLTPAGCWQATRLVEKGEWALLGTTMAPPYTDECIEFPDVDSLLAEYEDKSELIREFL